MKPYKKDYAHLTRKDTGRRVKKHAMGLITALVLQTLTAVWWAAQLDTRVRVQEQWIRQNTHLSEIVFRLEERIISLQADMNALQARRHQDAPPVR